MKIHNAEVETLSFIIQALCLLHNVNNKQHGLRYYIIFFALPPEHQHTTDSKHCSKTPIIIGVIIGIIGIAVGTSGLVIGCVACITKR